MRFWTVVGALVGTGVFGIGLYCLARWVSKADEAMKGKSTKKQTSKRKRKT